MSYVEEVFLTNFFPEFRQIFLELVLWKIIRKREEPCDREREKEELCKLY